MKKLSIENNKTRKRHKSLLKRLSLGAIALLVFASSTLQARAYYEKDPDLEYLRTAKALVERMDELYSQKKFSLTADIISGRFSATTDSEVKEFTDKVFSLAQAQTFFQTNWTNYSYQHNTPNQLTRLNLYLSTKNLREEKEADLLAAEIAKDIKSRSSDPRKRIALVNQYLINHVEYPEPLDYDNSLLWNSYGALVDGSAACQGYALAFNKIMRLLDIPVINVLGTVDGGEYHMWNQVLLDGQWLHVDVTFNDSEIWEEYFLLTDKELQRRSPRKEDSNVSKEEAQEVFYGNKLDHLAEILQKKGVFLDDDGGFRLDDYMTRAEMAIMLTRLTGGIDEIERHKDYYHLLGKGAFPDVPDWAAPYVAYCYKNRLVIGMRKMHYGYNRYASKLDYSTALLKASGIHLGYTYQTSDVEAVKQGFLSKTRAAFPYLSRGDAVYMTYNFLTK